MNHLAQPIPVRAAPSVSEPDVVAYYEDLLGRTMTADERAAVEYTEVVRLRENARHAMWRAERGRVF